MPVIRQPAVADQFYPGNPELLTRTVDSFLASAEAAVLPSAPKALVVPHAGYPYSGPIAATAYATIAAARDSISRVVLIGPSHRVALRGLATSSAPAFATPLGEVPLDRAAIARILGLPQVRELDDAHRFEHSLEVQLPFLQRVLNHFELVPLVAGDADPGDVAEVLEQLWGGPETLVLVSSDLSHYLSHDAARRIDAETSRAIEALRPQAIGHDQACGRIPVQALLLAAQRHSLHATTLDLRTSGDTSGPRDQVVGYGAYAFY